MWLGAAHVLDLHGGAVNLRYRPVTSGGRLVLHHGNDVVQRLIGLQPPPPSGMHRSLLLPTPPLQVSLKVAGAALSNWIVTSFYY